MAFNHIDYVRNGLPDLTHRQMAMLMLICRTMFAHTVRGLAADLNVTKPVITRAANTLTAMGLVERKKDATDGRNVFIVPTVAGRTFIASIGG